MKKCPVCGVMMGDNVARCFMCKYDFQKAASEGEEAARKDAKVNVFQVEQEANVRAAEKKAENDKILADVKAKSRLEIEAMERQLEGEKLRLEQEYVEIRKKSFDEKSRLDAELADIRKQIEDEANLYKKARKDREKLIDTAKAAAQGEAEKIINEIHDETAALAIQVQQEYAQAMAEKQKIIDEASRLSEESEETQQKCELVKLEYEQQVRSLEEAKKRAEDEAEHILELAREAADATKLQSEKEAEGIRKQAEIDAASKLMESEKACKDYISDAERLRLEAENTRAMAESELAAYVNEAKTAIAAAEEAQKTREKTEEEIRTIIGQAEVGKVSAEEAKRKAEEEAQTIFLKVEETKRLAMQEEQEILIRSQEAKLKAQQDEQVYTDELEKTKNQVQQEIDQIMEQRRTAWAEAEQEAAALTKELQEAAEMAKEAQEARDAARVEAEEARLSAAEEAQRIVLDAEKRAIVLKENGISQSEKGRIAREYEEASQTRQKEIAALQQVLSEREEDLKRSEQKVSDMMLEIEKLRENQLRNGFRPVSVPMDYEVEVIVHMSTGEVNSEAIAEALARRGHAGWKLHSLVNDEGGRLQASMGVAEKYSLASGASNKEDRVILIFERVAAVNEEE